MRDAFMLRHLETVLTDRAALMPPLPILPKLLYWLRMSEFHLFEHYDCGNAPIFIFADHAGKVFPGGYDALGLSQDRLETHIASDIGAGPLAMALGRQLEARAFLCRFSRLLIDPNRAIDQADLIPEMSDCVPIPGNQALSPSERQMRIETYYQPYHDALELAISATCAAHEDPLIISVHSFTPRLTGDAQIRPWHVGLLWQEDEATERKFMSLLREDTDFLIGDNQPYNARGLSYSIDCHVVPKELRHLTLEIRQDLIATDAGIDEVANKLVAAICRL